MNTSAQKHLAKARGYVAKGEEFYRKAAEEIVAAQQADPTLSNREIGEQFDRSERWIRDLVTWVTSSDASPKPSPFAREPGIASEDRSAAKKVLREAPMEQVERIISELPKERQQAIGAAGGNEYMKARQEYAEHEANLTPVEKKEREAAKADVSELAGRVTAGIDALAIVNHIEQATDKLSEMIENRTLTADNGKEIAKAFERFAHELEVAVMMVGLELDLRMPS